MEMDEKWITGAERRAERLGDGWVKTPESDWDGLVSLFKFGERLYEAERRERVLLVSRLTPLVERLDHTHGLVNPADPECSPDLPCLRCSIELTLARALAPARP